MGSSCGKDSSPVQQKKTSIRSESVNQYVDTASIADVFTISLESFVTSTSRISAKRTLLTKGCKSVVVTKIRLDLNQQFSRVAKTCGLHMPVLSLSNTDVKFQLPELLPLNLWGGTQTIYSFVYPDVADNSCVTLTGKVGTKPISIRQRIDKGQTFTAEAMMQHGKDIETEMRRYEKNKVKTKKDSSVVEASHSNSDSNGRGSGRKISSGRSSVATPYSGISYAGDSTDSDTASAKMRAREKRPKSRRKDTPSQQISLSQRRALNYAKLKLYKQQQDGECFPEEAESVDMEDCEFGTDDDVVRHRKTSQCERWQQSDQPGQPGQQGAGRVTLGAGVGQPHLPARFTRSFNNIRELCDESPVDGSNLIPRSPQSWSEQPAFRRKKRSIGCKLANQVRPAGDAGSNSPGREFPPFPASRRDPGLAEPHDVNNDADDEDENVAKHARTDGCPQSAGPCAADKTDDNSSTAQERTDGSRKHEQTRTTRKMSVKNEQEIDTNEGVGLIKNRDCNKASIGKGIGKKTPSNDSVRTELRRSLDHGSVSYSSANEREGPVATEHSASQSAHKITLRVKEADIKAGSDGGSRPHTLPLVTSGHTETGSTLASSTMPKTKVDGSPKSVADEADASAKQEENKYHAALKTKDDKEIDMEQDITSPGPRTERASTMSGQENPRKTLRFTISMDEIADTKHSPTAVSGSRVSPGHVDDRPSPVQAFDEHRLTGTPPGGRPSPVFFAFMEKTD